MRPGRKSALRAAALVAATALVGCEGPAEPTSPAPPEGDINPSIVLSPVEGFAHEAGVDRRGYYVPLTAVQVGDLRLSHLSIGDASAFEAWESGAGRTEPLFPPIMLQFEDMASERTPNELGGQDPSVVLRVLPSGYGVSTGQVRFAGDGERLGRVTFEGRFLEEGLPPARVLRGTLTIDGQIFEGQGFAWSPADQALAARTKQE